MNEALLGKRETMRSAQFVCACADVTGRVCARARAPRVYIVPRRSIERGRLVFHLNSANNSAGLLSSPRMRSRPTGATTDFYYPVPSFVHSSRLIRVAERTIVSMATGPPREQREALGASLDAPSNIMPRFWFLRSK